MWQGVRYFSIHTYYMLTESAALCRVGGRKREATPAEG